MEAKDPTKPSVGANIANSITNFALGNAAQIDANKYAVQPTEKDNTLLLALSAIGGITLAVLIVILFIILKK